MSSGLIGYRIVAGISRGFGRCRSLKCSLCAAGARPRRPQPPRPPPRRQAPAAPPAPTAASPAAAKPETPSATNPAAPAPQARRSRLNQRTSGEGSTGEKRSICQPRPFAYIEGKADKDEIYSSILAIRLALVKGDMDKAKPDRQPADRSPFSSNRTTPVSNITQDIRLRPPPKANRASPTRSRSDKRRAARRCGSSIRARTAILTPPMTP